MNKKNKQIVNEKEFKLQKKRELLGQKALRMRGEGNPLSQKQINYAEATLNMLAKNKDFPAGWERNFTKHWNKYAEAYDKRLNTETKRCTRCKKVLLLKQYYTAGDTYTRMCWCIECDKARHHWRNEHQPGYREAKNAKTKEWRENHPERTEENIKCSLAIATNTKIGLLRNREAEKKARERDLEGYLKRKRESSRRSLAKLKKDPVRHAARKAKSLKYYYDNNKTLMAKNREARRKISLEKIASEHKQIGYYCKWSLDIDLSTIKSKRPRVTISDIGDILKYRKRLFRAGGYKILSEKVISKESGLTEIKYKYNKGGRRKDG